jgi:eukaryotic-like serine/threonine-protein kinase
VIRSGTDQETPEGKGGALLDRIALAYARHYPAAAGGRDFSGQVFGDYRLLERVSRGGMGEVYLAERADGAFESRVAVKLLRASIDSDVRTRRFARERQLLARLEHPGIARLLDGGSGPQDIPFLVMEWVDGEPITAHVQRQQLKLESRLKLFADVCRAVSYAHRNLIVHRDLKPSNILVTRDGKVKLLDFGIGKLLSADEDQSLTRTGAVPMTQAYAAPEQILGHQVTTATDVFALGVVLYELVTGERPHRRDAHAPAALAAQVDTEVVTRPSEKLRRQTGDSAARRISRRLKGDLDTIILTALRRESDRRYASAEALLEDLRRHSEGLPIRARPDTAGYRIGKFLRRHSIGVTATALVMFALVGALSFSLWQSAGRKAEAERANAVQEFLISVFRAADPRVNAGENLTARELLDLAESRVGEEFVNRPRIQAELLTVIAETRQWQQNQLAAEAAAQRAFDVLAPHARRNDLLWARVMRSLAFARYRLDRIDGVEWLLEESARILEWHGEHMAALQVHNALAGVYRRSGGESKAVLLQKEIVARMIRIEGEVSYNVGKANIDLGIFARDIDDLDLSEAALLKGIGIFEEVDHQHHPVYAQGHLMLADVLHRTGRDDEATARFAEAVRLAERSYVAGGAAMAQLISIHGQFLLQQAQGGVEQVIQGTQAMLEGPGLGSLSRGELWRVQGLAWLKFNQLDNARAAFGGAAEEFAVFPGVESRRFRQSQAALHYVEFLQNEDPASLQGLMAEVRWLLEAGGPVHELAMYLTWLADSLRTAADYDGAAAWYSCAYDLTRHRLSEQSSYTRNIAAVWQGLAVDGTPTATATAAQPCR